jgi:hypothetical protein
MGRSTFEGTLQEARGGGAYVALPADVLAALGGTRQRVRGTVNGVDFQSSTMPTGGGTACLGVHRATREAAGAEFGQRVTVEVEVDDRPRQVEVPPDLAGALSAEPALQAAFDRLSYTNRKEYAEWIAGAKREETRSRRLAETLDRLREM